MNAEQIRAEAIEVVARASWEALEQKCGAVPWEQAPGHRREGGRIRAAAVVDALAAAGLLPTVVEEVETGVWGTDRFDRRRVRYLTEWREVSE